MGMFGAPERSDRFDGASVVDAAGEEVRYGLFLLRRLVAFDGENWLGGHC